MFVHARAIHDSALALIAAGVNDCEIAWRLGVPRTTVRDWRAPRYQRKPVETCRRCWRCWRATRPVAFTAADYAELLGLYLGDGHITRLTRTERLRIFLDSRHGLIVAETDALLRRCFPSNRLGYLRPAGKRMVVLWIYHGHLSCLFPQHGPGKRHERRIVLESWQADLVREAPWAFLRGLIRSRRVPCSSIARASTSTCRTASTMSRQISGTCSSPRAARWASSVVLLERACESTDEPALR